MVLGLVLILWGADAAARTAAQSLIARDVQDATGSPDRPAVNVGGFAFLPQVLRGVYDEVDVTTVGVTSGPLRIDRVDSRLSDVRIPFHDVLVRDVRPFTVGQSDQVVTLLFSDLTNYLNATGHPFELTSQADDRVELTGELDILNRRVTVRSAITLTVVQGELRITPDQIDTGSAALNRVSRLLLAQRLTLAVPMDTLPFGNELVDVHTTPTGVRIHAVGTAVVVDP